MATKKATSNSEQLPKALILGIHTPYLKTKNPTDYFEEFKNLIKTTGLQYNHELFIKLRSIDKSNFLTKGKLLELAQFCKDNEIEEVIISELITPLQERNLQDFLNCKIFDREQLILEIFRNAAHSAEGKIQVEMAELEFLKTRLAGRGIELAQQAGHIGTRGPGETEREFFRRHIAEKYRQAKKRLQVMQKSRNVQRKKRLGSNIPMIGIVGYTNAGKSTILNTLTKSNILAEDKLFATLDTTTRELFIGNKKIALISDTVGFINQLPHHLIEAFKSTLDELNYADLLLHIVDLSNHAWKHQIKVVLDTLDEIGINKPMLYVFNKIDKLSEEEIEKITSEELAEYQPNVLVYATDKTGLSNLLEYLSQNTPKKL